MEFKKERNFIVGYNDLQEMCGKWDILTGQFIGKSGKVIKNCPSAFTYNNLNIDNVYAQAIKFYRELATYYGAGYARLYTAANRASRMEELVSVGLIPANIVDLDDSTKLTKKIVEYIKNDWRGIYHTDHVKAYMVYIKYSAMLENKPHWYQRAFHEAIRYDDMPDDYTKAFLDRAELEHMIDFYDNDIRSLCEVLTGYYKKCMEMYGEVKINHNLLTSYSHICALYKVYHNAHLSENITKHNNLETLYFSDGDYIIRPLLTAEEFHDEAEAQSNCVERLYMDKVANGKTHVVVVRRADNPDKSLITCEVTNDGAILQYLAQYNHTVHDEELINLRKAYAQHLEKNWKG